MWTSIIKTVQPSLLVVAMLILIGGFWLAWRRTKNPHYFHFIIASALNAAHLILGQVYMMYIRTLTPGRYPGPNIPLYVIDTLLYSAACLIALSGAIHFLRDEMRRARVSKYYETP